MLIRNLSYLEEIQALGLRVGVVVDPPRAFDCFDKRVCPNPGYGLEIALLICQILKIHCRFTRANHTQYGDNKDGTWRGMIRQIMDGEFDTSLPVFQVVDFSEPVLYVTNQLITHAPAVSTFSSETLLHIFSWQTWITMTAAIIFIGCIIAAAQSKSTVQHYCLRTIKAILKSSLDTVGLLAAQGVSSSNFTTSTTYLIFAVWAFACVVLGGVFSSFIIANALSVSVTRAFTDIESLAKCIDEKKCVLITDTVSSSFFEEIYSARSGEMYTLQRALANSPPELVPRSELGSSVLAFDKKVSRVLFKSESTVIYMIQTQPSCSYDMIKLPYHYVECFPVRKEDKSLKSALSDAVTIAVDSGLVDRIHRRYIGRGLAEQNSCLTVSVLAVPIPMKMLYVVLVLFGAGFLLGLIALIVENCKRAIMARRIQF